MLCIIVIGEQSRHHQGCANSRNCIAMRIYMDVREA